MSFIKATGIVRRMDDLGRVVIPKEVRRIMHIKNGDSLEIYTRNNSELIFKAKSPLLNITEQASNYAEAIYKGSGYPAMICYGGKVIAVSGLPRQSLVKKKSSDALGKLLEQRKPFYKPVRPVGGVDCQAIAGAPIIIDSEIRGAVLLLSNDKPTYEDEGIALVKIGADYLSSIFG